ncbi:MAG: 50S ribosomal protein L10 [Crocinitomicaceae bacterium]|nr:50S ribosomal protein L10 [Crocinitomicaceae bacterium]|tara:strand:- start:396 stop:920 length:525 start_codon:yes stop_codon:yes gene_type:complete
MTREEKNKAISDLTETLASKEIIYLADISDLDADTTSKLRRQCFKSDITLQVVKNTLLKKAMESVEGKDFSELYDVLKGNTSIMYCETANAPAKLIKDFRKKAERPILKAAYVQEAVFVGDDKIDALASLKSKEELIADVIMLLQSPTKNVISQLQSGGQKLTGILKALSEKEA